jgi:hypothetical protein
VGIGVGLVGIGVGLELVYGFAHSICLKHASKACAIFMTFWGKEPFRCRALTPSQIKECVVGNRVQAWPEEAITKKCLIL